jgi:hypothetical protein
VKTPTKKELQELAVRALGEGVTVRVKHPRGSKWYMASALADNGIEEVYVWSTTEDRSKRALAAALEALAEVRK